MPTPGGVSIFRHPTKTAVGTTTVTLAAAGADRRLLVHKITAIGASAAITVTDQEGTNTIWTSPAAGETFFTPLRSTKAGDHLLITATGASALSVQYAHEGA